MADLRNIRRVIKQLNELSDFLENYGDDYKNKHIKEIKQEFQYIGDSEIDKFYESYEPGSSRDPFYVEAGMYKKMPTPYDRLGSLYYAYELKETKNGLSFIFNHDLENTSREYLGGMKHRASNEYIYENSFVNGWHGGAIAGEGHPEPGIPHWRSGFTTPPFDDWIYDFPAVRSDSPYLRIKKRATKYRDSIQEDFQNTLDDTVKNYKSRIYRLLGR